MLHALLTFAAEAAGHEEPSKVPFYVAGTVLAAWAVAVSALGIARHANWPGSGSGRAVMGISALLVIAAMATSVITG